MVNSPEEVIKAAIDNKHEWKLLKVLEKLEIRSANRLLLATASSRANNGILNIEDLQVILKQVTFDASKLKLWPKIPKS